MRMTLSEISIELTQRCPNRCIHCSSMSCPEARKELDTDVVVEVLDDAKNLGAKVVCFSGGEPFLHPDFLKIVSYAHDLGLKIYVYSSGITLQDERPASISYDTLFSIKEIIEKLIINIEASTPTLYDRIMGTDFGGFELMHQTISTSVQLGIKVEGHMVPMNINVGEIQNVITLCKHWGVSRISFLRLVLQGRALDNIHLTHLDTIDHVITRQEISELRDINKGSIRVGIPFRSCSERVNCWTGTSKLNIRYDGNVYPCEAFKNDMPFGLTRACPDNVNQRRLNDIYSHSAYLIEIRQKLDAFQQVATCETCMNQYYRKENEYR